MSAAFPALAFLVFVELLFKLFARGRLEDFWRVFQNAQMMVDGRLPWLVYS
jgi:hypothetical protein